MASEFAKKLAAALGIPVEPELEVYIRKQKAYHLEHTRHFCECGWVEVEKPGDLCLVCKYVSVAS